MLTERRKPGPSRSLSRDRIVAAGLELTANSGLGSLSLRSVAQHLGVDHKTLYTYVSDKDDLLAGMFDVALRDLVMPTGEDDRSPADQLVDLFVSIRRVLIANIDLFHLSRPKTVVSDLGAAERILAALHALVPEAHGAAELYAALTQLAVGSAMETVQARDSSGPRDNAVFPGFAAAWDDLDRDAAFERLLRTVVQSSVDAVAPRV